MPAPVTVPTPANVAIWSVLAALLVAIAFVVVAAFGTIRQHFTEDVKPAIAGALLATLNTASEYGFGAVIAAIIQFVLIAAVVYFAIIVPINKLNDMSYRLIHGKPKPAVEAAVTEKDILEEIRDLLKAQQDSPAKLQGEGPETRA